MRKSKSVDKVPFLAPDTVTKVIPAPTDGWDAISPLAEMDPKRAPILVNWVPRPGWVELRGGYTPWNNTGSGTEVNSLMVYRASSSQQMFAASASKIFNVSTAGTVTTVQTGLSSDKWQYVNFTNAAGGHVIQLVNGSDNLRQWDGTSWTTPSITGLPNSAATSSIINIGSQKQRLWYILVNSTIVAYLGTGANTGAIAGTLDLGAYWNLGGYMVAMADWTIDGGVGPQDYVAFISSQGQIALFAGTDPTNSSAWQLVGVFKVAPPIGYRCLTQIGSDVAVITQQGVLPLSQALPFDPSADRSVAITARIQNAMASAAMTAQTNFGWEFILYPNQQLAVLNVPFTTNQQQYQYVMNTLTGAWTQFQGWNANTFAFYNNNLYFGDNFGVVQQAYSGSNDGINSIAADMQCAFNWLDEPGRTKRMTMVQPLLTLSGNLTPTIAVDVDFITSAAVAPISTFTGTVVWDSAIWDTSVWPTTTNNYASFLSVDALGHALAIHMRINVTGLSNASGVFDIGTFGSAEFDSNQSSNLPILQVNAFNSIAELGGAI